MATDDLGGFVKDRLVSYLRELGYRSQEVDAVLAKNPLFLAELPQRLEAVRVFAALPEAASLTSANKRISNILKKKDESSSGGVAEGLLREPAERDLFQQLELVGEPAAKKFSEGKYIESLQLLASLKGPVDRFFDEVLVNVEDDSIRVNRHTLLQRLRATMNHVADLSRLAT
jgi:glycyl-tRNA synthetase beta chain